jgi:hypothetical protein
LDLWLPGKEYGLFRVGNMLLVPSHCECGHGRAKC